MSSEIVCPHCQARYPARPELIGRMLACKKCKQTFTVEGARTTWDEEALDEVGGEYTMEGGGPEPALLVNAPPGGIYPDAEPADPRPKKKRKKKKKSSLSFDWLSSLPLPTVREYASETQTQMIVMVALLGIPTLLAIVTGGWKPAMTAASVVIALTLVATIGCAFLLYLGSSESGAWLLIGSCMFTPVFVIVVLLGMIYCFEEYPQVPLAFGAAVGCALTLGWFFGG